MKHLYCFFSVFLLVFAFSCNQIIQEDITTLSDSLATRSEEASEITTDTTHFMASSFNPSLKVRLRQHFGEKQFTKQTVSRDDAPLLQVLNFEGGGWAIVDARNEDADLILAYDDGGCFDAENITSPEVAFWFYLLQDQLACEKETSNKSEEQGPEEPLRSWPIDYSLDYYWVRLPVGPVIVTQETANIPHLTQTKWGQGVPWNRFCYYQGTHFVTGCAPVAVSQMLYYLHYHIGFPSGLYHTIIPTFTAYPTYENGILTDCYWRITHIDRDDFTSPSTRWDDMALDKGDWSYTPGTDYVGNLMVDIGARINIRYHPLGSDTESIETEIFAQYGITCDKLFGFNEDTVKRYLSNAQPVIVSGWIPDSSGHAWIIDGYKAVTEITYSGYQWVLIPPDSLSYYPNLNYDYVLTEHQKELLYPNVQEYDMEYYDPSAPSYKVYYRMNWGANGSYDDGLYLLDFQHGWCSDSDTLNFSRYLCTIQNYHLQ